ncbi:glutamate-5-semialdehyde dehydrogenase [Peribacillus huizhouensis]|uniref:Gamma-glutamyl phosphate reductase n=1 Tax=Peribacillus huizhouensis TaxID=1501239 RepID=A0ABR6CSP2_9BACI|nr:glutamate-5-semialdehyde dehydrogenase [Peribacillus huizhouensis]MBA9027741.1 glutamate-5-semialdehyde dehydrogenase [Peribacillus huizhouensis]
MGEIAEKGIRAKAASYQMVNVSTIEKNEALAMIAKQLIAEQSYIMMENKKDLEVGSENGLTTAVLDRIMLDEKRIMAMAEAIQLLIELPDPIGETLETIEKENGLLIKKERVPLGVIGMIYEARPNVTIDAATLSLKTGNAVILRGSSSAQHSNQAIIKVIHQALKNTKLPVDAVQLIEDTSRETAKELFHASEYLDVLIPRGSKNLIDTVVRESTVPVLETGAGNCHIYLDESADFAMATEIIVNAKTQRPSVCNAVESLVIQEKWLELHGKELLKLLHDTGIRLFGDNKVLAHYPEVNQATEADWSTEYLDLSLSVKTVANVLEAVQHINTYGTKHSEAILTNDKVAAKFFLTNVDAAAVYHNASTRFTDGFEFGYGAEIGISTQKLHARGPMGLPALTSTKYFIYGQGQIRS